MLKYNETIRKGVNAVAAKTKKKIQPKFKQITVMVFISLFQLLSAACVLYRGEEMSVVLTLIFMGYMVLEWLYMMIGIIATGTDYFELEAMAFFLCGIGITVCASYGESYALKQIVAVLMGLAVYLVMQAVLKNIDFCQKIRLPVAVLSILILIANLILAGTTNGTLNWIDLGFFSIQPSEIVKIAFVFVGAVTLEYLISNTSLTRYIIFSVACIGLLFLMQDFGTALIFFFTFILIAFMRSGDVRTIALICTAALLGAVLIIYFKPYVASRFQAYGRVWDYADTSGYQQVRTLVYMASGGLLGLGIGEGRLRNVYASSTDLIFGVVCEEMGLIVGLCVLICFVGFALFAVITVRQSGSSFYAIAATAAAGMLLFQLSLNIFGITDILPLTGVTLPFVSRGGSSMICSWGLLAYIRAAGVMFRPPEAIASIPVSRPVRKAPAGRMPNGDIPVARRQGRR